MYAYVFMCRMYVCVPSILRAAAAAASACCCWLLRAAARHLVWCGVVWCGVVWCGVVYVRRLLSQLSPLQEVELASALRRLATALSGRFINSVSGHCGCGFDIKMAKAVVAVLNERYGLDLVWRTRVQVESDPDKQYFLMREHPDVEMLVPDMVCLASAMPRDTMAMPIPWRCLPWRCLGSHGDASGCMYV